MKNFTKKAIALFMGMLALPFVSNAQTTDYVSVKVGESFSVEALMDATAAVPYEYVAEDTGILTVKVTGNLQSLSFHMPNSMGSILFTDADHADAVAFYEEPVKGPGPWTYQYSVTEGSTYYFALWGPTGYTVDLLSLTEGGTVGVNSIATEIENSPVYNMNGVRVNKENLQKGIYIVNGKKFMVK